MTPLEPVQTYDLLAELARRFACPGASLHLVCTYVEDDGDRVVTFVQSGIDPDEVQAGRSQTAEWLDRMQHAPEAMSYDDITGVVIDVR